MHTLFDILPCPSVQCVVEFASDSMCSVTLLHEQLQTQIADKHKRLLVKQNISLCLENVKASYF